MLIRLPCAHFTGDSSLHLLNRLQNGEMENMKPKVAVVLIGTNDLSWYWERDMVWGSVGSAAMLAKPPPFLMRTSV